jgi:hypothetical protein
MIRVDLRLGWIMRQAHHRSSFSRHESSVVHMSHIIRARNDEQIAVGAEARMVDFSPMILELGSLQLHCKGCRIRLANPNVKES